VLPLACSTREHHMRAEVAMEFFYHQPSSFLIISALSPLGNEAKKYFCNLRNGIFLALGNSTTILMTYILQQK